MSSLQPLYDVKERLEHAAIAGTGLLGEDFRLQRAAESMRPLAAASPVFGKISAGLEKLLAASAEERPGLLLDVLGLVDAVAYTQGSSGLAGELEDLPTAGGGTCQQISYGQIQPLLNALTATGGGRMEIIQSTWEAHPEFFSDFRVLPAVVEGLGDSYGEISELNARILKSLGSVVTPLLKKDFDPSGKREMARRVEVLAAVEGADATPWLRDVLPEAKKDVRTAVLLALGEDMKNAGLLLELAESERGKNRDAVLSSLAKQEGTEIQAFWEKELEKNGQSVEFLIPAAAGWASDLVAAGLRRQLEELVQAVLAGQERLSKEEPDVIALWIRAAQGKSSPAMLEFWRWADGQLGLLSRLKNHIGQPYALANRLSDCLLNGLYQVRQGPLCELCAQLHQQDLKRAFYVPHGFVAAMFDRPAEEVYEEFSPYLLTRKPLLDDGRRRACHEAMLRTLLGLHMEHRGAARLDRRWVLRLLDAVWTELPGKQTWYPAGPNGMPLGSYEMTLTGLADPEDPEHCAGMSAYFLRRMVEAADWQTYGRIVLRFHGDPGAVLRETLSRSAKQIYLYYVWEFCHEATGQLTPEETAAMLEEFLRADRFRKEDKARAEKAIPYTAALLRAGKPFPEWDEWWKMQ